MLSGYTSGCTAFDDGLWFNELPAMNLHLLEASLYILVVTLDKQ